MNPTYRKKLIEVALPLDAINKESAREKSIRHGHPSTLHLWWARRPLAACRAVLFSSLVNDPGDDPMYGLSEDIAATERAKLFNLIEDLVKWENSNNPRVINAARLEIARSIAANKVADGELADDTPLVADAPKLPEEQEKYLPDPPPEYTAHDVRFKMPGLKPEQVNHFLAHYAPPVLDPFAGGGSIPLEAQRLGLRAYASDLNPVPVLINKALIEIPPKFAGMPPVNPEARKRKLKSAAWRGAQGLAEDVRYYGKWMRDEAEKRIGHLYPKVKVTEEMAAGWPDLEPHVGQELIVVVWLWCRTVKCPNPACGCRMPMISTFWLLKKNKHKVFVEPKIDRKNQSVHFTICTEGVPPPETSNRSMARCLFCDNVMKKPQLREQASEHGLEALPLAVVAEINGHRFFLDPACCPQLELPKPDATEIAQPMTDDKRWFSPPLYGLPTFRDLFTPRQLTTLLTFSDLVGEVRERVFAVGQHATENAGEYADAVATYLAFAANKGADYWTTISTWMPRGTVGHALNKQAIPMTWDFPEANPLVAFHCSWNPAVEWVAKAIESFATPTLSGVVRQNSALSIPLCDGCVVSTDPPYYDNIGYADLSDFFYVWLRRSLQLIYPDALGTMLSPKAEELIASSYRHNGSKAKASKFFETGLSDAIGQWRRIGCNAFPTTIFYAFKQAESDNEGTSSTGWETFLEGVIENGFAITATWPMRTERSARSTAIGTNALASSIVLACVPRLLDASMVTRRDFVNALRKELPEAIKHLQSGNVAPVDLAQASIGPGMAVFSRYSKVVNADGSPMSVREALQLINQMLDESLVEQESDFDSETRFALRWFEQYGMQEGPFGDAETLAKAMAVAVNGVVEAGILEAKAGKVRLLRRDELAHDWDPMTDSRLVAWEVIQYLIRTLEQDGEMATAELARKVGSMAGNARELAYRLYATCERKKWAQEALAYNSLVIAWPEISKLARQVPKTQTQQEMF
ncbi:MAG: DUF1156 domain-containing protein [Pirellulaceae bacterium]|nr:DUF1156 domain-containing protein [Pirellulaceae bacterium]